MKSKQILDVHQMQHLQELGLEMKETMLYWVVYEAGHENNFVTTKEDAMEVIDESCGMLPAYTLQDVLDALPNRIIDEKGFDYFLAIHIYNNIWNVVYSLYNEILVTINYFNSECLIDAAYEMLVWCIENKFVETNKNE